MDTKDPKAPVTPKHTLGNFLVGNGCILLATVFFGINVPVSKSLIPDWMSANDITSLRVFGGCVCFWLISLFMKNDRIDRSDYLRIFFGGTIGFFLFIYLFNSSLHYGDPIDISIIMTFPPVFVILIGIIFRHARTSALEIAGVVVGLAGAALVIIGGGGGAKGSDNILGDLLALASTVCYAVYLTILDKTTPKYKPVSLLRWVFLAAALPALIIVWKLPDAPLWHATEAAPWLSAGFVMLLVTVLSYFLITPAVKRIGSELTSMYQYVLPVFATIASVVMGLAKLHWIQVVAMAVIILGMAMTTVAKRRQARKAS